MKETARIQIQSLREGGLPFRSQLSKFDREMEEAETSPVTHVGDVENMKDIIHHV